MTTGSTLKSSVRRSSKHVAAATIVSKIIAMTLQVYLFRMLSVIDQGIYSWFLGTQFFFIFFTNLGMPGSLQRFIPEYYALGHYRKIGKIYSATAVTNFLVSVLVFSIIYWLYRPLAALPFVKMQNYQDVFLCFAGSSILFFQLNILNTVLTNLFLHAWQTWAQVFYALLKSGITFAFIKMGFGLKGIFIADALALLPIVIFLFVYHRIWLKRKIRQCNDTDGSVEWRRFSRYSFFNLLTIPQGVSMDISMAFVIVKPFLTPYQFGLYSFCGRFSQMILQALPHRMLQSVIRPMFYARFTTAKNKDEAIGDMFNGLCRITLFFLMPAFAVIAFASSSVIHAVDAKYLSAEWLLVVTFALLVASFADLSADLAIQAIEKVQYRFYSQFIGIASMVVTLLLLKAGMGVMSVVISTGIVASIRAFYLTYILKRFVQFSLEWKSFAIIAVNSLAMGIVVRLVVSFVPGNIGLGIAVVAGGLVYLLASYLLSPFSKSEQQHIQYLLKLRTSA